MDADDVHLTRRESGRGPDDDLVQATRRDAPPPPVGETRREPSPRERLRPAWEEVGATRRESGSLGDAGARGLMALPSALATEYEIEEELHPGAEADVLQIVNAAGERRVAKIYRRGIHPDPSVWAALPRLRSDHVVTIWDFGTSDGRDYEVMEYAAAGNLTTLLVRRQLSSELIGSVVGQIADALVALHRESIVHRDLKPENVLVRRVDDDGIDVAVTDFGLARVLEHSIVHGSRSGTLAYQPPEALLPSGAEVSSKWDWWSLGMIVRELATGVRAHAQMSAPAVEKAVLIHGLDVGDVADPRLRLLCRGLLTHNARDRWGADQVALWRAGHSPEVADARGETAERIAPFRFDETEHRSRESLARGLQNGWATAARRFFAGMSTPDSPAEGWRRLRAWLQQFADDPGVDRDAFEELLDQTLVDPASTPDRRLLALVSWLDPSLPVLYRGTPVTRENLTRLALLLRQGESPEHAGAVTFFRGLFEPGLVADIARRQEYAWLGEVDHARRVLRSDEIRYREHWAPYLPPGAFPDPDDPRIDGAVLYAVLEPGRAEAELRQTVQQHLAAMPVPIAWYDNLARRAATFLDHLVAAEVYPAALGEATRIKAEQDRQAADRLAREEHWRQVEQQRLAATDTGLALRYLIGATVVAAVLLVVHGFQVGSDPALVVWVLLNVLVVGAAVGYLWVSELRLAQKLGGDYRGRTRFSRSGRGYSSLGSNMTAGKGCLILVVGSFALGLVVTAPMVAAGFAVVLQLLSLRRREQDWSVWHGRAHHEIMGGRP